MIVFLLNQQFLIVPCILFEFFINQLLIHPFAHRWGYLNQLVFIFFIFFLYKEFHLGFLLILEAKCLSYSLFQSLKLIYFIVDKIDITK
jgi:hypothetical protein